MREEYYILLNIALRGLQPKVNITSLKSHKYTLDTIMVINKDYVTCRLEVSSGFGLNIVPFFLSYLHSGNVVLKQESFYEWGLESR